MVDSILNHARGLPLALEVLGSFLCGRREDVWESTLRKLSRLPNKIINDVLKISYNGLEENAKEIFLHIACSFKGKDSNYIKKVLDSCDFETAVGFDIVIERSLISIENGPLQMHDLIQVMGIDIVNQECRYDPRRRSRLWLYDDILDVLSSDMGDCAVKAIVLEPFEPIEICIDPDAFTKMRRLRLLILRNVHNSFQGPVCLPNWLRWFECPGASWIPEFSSGTKKLVGLNMSEGNITGVVKKFKDFQNLKYITFGYCESLVRMPDLSCTPNLEQLNLSYCKNLVEAHESIAYHDKLQVLNLSECSELSVFANVLKSKNLQALHLANCTKFERFLDIPYKLEGLKQLHLQGTAIKELPTSIENFVSLEIMYIYCCKNLESLPSSIYKLQNLENLQVNSCTNLIGFPKYEDSTDPYMNTGLSNLRWLDLYGCNLSEVKFLENLSCFPFLETLLLGGNNITSLPTSINKRDHLLHLSVRESHQLQEILELPPFLNCLLADGCESMQNTGDLTSFHDFVRRGVTMADSFSLDLVSLSLSCSLSENASGGLRKANKYEVRGEMPEWVLPVEEDSVSFKASKDLYDKFLGFALYVALGNDEQKKGVPFELVPCVNGECWNYWVPRYNTFLSDSDHIWLQYFIPSQLWGVVDFGQIDESYVQFSLTISGGIVKKWGFRIICVQLEDNLKVVLQDNQLMDPALLYEVVLESIDSEAKISLMHEDNSIETDLQKDLQDCQVCAEEKSQIVPKRNHKLILPRGMQSKTMLTSNSIGIDENGSVGLQLLLLE
ncbi:TMV resistance protein N-like [Syzygium oleosum]|uniref:TMV resistance protein N-like n=1 Tax=Syzygium oleosum TaxID=219896 RepID=UPI0024BB0D1F|nr:TMV resistance protein N-like [Syzygium oleosum]